MRIPWLHKDEDKHPREIPQVREGPPWTCQIFEVRDTHVRMRPYPMGSTIPGLPENFDLTMNHHDPKVFKDAGRALVVGQLILVFDWGWVGARMTEIIDGYRETVGSTEKPRVTSASLFRPR
jgi:hypothetical protein